MNVDVVPRLRPARNDDAPAIVEIWELGWREAHLGRVPEELVVARTPTYFRTRTRGQVDRTTVALVGGVVVGFMMVLDDEVEQLYVDVSHRGADVASALLTECEHQIRSAGHNSAWLAVVADNGTARKFYERHGWIDMGDFEHVAPGEISVPAHRYLKRLT